MVETECYLKGDLNNGWGFIETRKCIKIIVDLMNKTERLWNLTNLWKINMMLYLWGRWILGSRIYGTCYMLKIFQCLFLEMSTAFSVPCILLYSLSLCFKASILCIRQANARWVLYATLDLRGKRVIQINPCNQGQYLPGPCCSYLPIGFKQKHAKTRWLSSEPGGHKK